MDLRVAEQMLPYLTTAFGNSGSLHQVGHRARLAVDHARAQIAEGLGARSEEIVFTSGATESNNLAIKGVAMRKRRRGDHLVSVATEHRAVLDPLRKLQKRGHQLTLLPVDDQGVLSAQQVAEAIRPETCLVSVMLANNEIGTLQPLAEIAEICHRQGVLLHTDATQAVGKIPLDVRDLGVDLLSFSSHKIYGPPGMGALYIRQGSPRVRLESQIDGGGQQEGRRSGTLPTALIVGFAAALGFCLDDLSEEMVRLRGLRDRLYLGLKTKIGDLQLNGPPLEGERRLYNNLNVSFPGVDGEALMLNTGRVCVSSGSACTAADAEPSHVLQALGFPEDRVRASLRFGVGRLSTEEEIDLAVGQLHAAVDRLRAMVS